MGTEENIQAEEPVFTFKEVGKEENMAPNSEVVEIAAEEIIDDKTKPEEQPEIVDKKDPEIKTENKEGEKTKPEEQPEKKEEEEEEEIVNLDEELAFKYLKDKKGLKVDTIEDFLKLGEAKKVDPEFEKYQEYKSKTGRGFGDFLETQKDWSKETPETIIKATLKLENPDLSSDDIDFLFEKDYGFDEEIDEDFDIRSKKISLKVDAKKALAVLEKQKEDYNVARGSEDDDNIPDVYKEAKEVVERLYDEQTENEAKSKVLRDDFVSKTQALLDDKFEGFEYTVDGQVFKVKPEDIKTTRETQLDIANFQKKFFDKENKLTDAKGYHRALFPAIDPEKFATHFYNLGKTSYAEQLEKESKNIDVKGEKHIPEPQLTGFTFKVSK